MNEKITLAIESGIEGGSLSCFKGTEQIDYEAGQREMMRSEELIHLVERLLEKNKISRKSLSNLAFSNGPGSLTGIRSGAASGLGLQTALKIPLNQINLFDAVQSCCQNLNQNLLIGLPSKKNEVLWQLASDNDLEEFRTERNSQAFLRLADDLREIPKICILLPDSLFGLAEYNDTKNTKNTKSIINLGKNLSYFVGQYSIKCSSNQSI